MLVAVTIMALLEVALRPLLMALALPIGLIAVALIGLLFRIALFLDPAAGGDRGRQRSWSRSSRPASTPPC